jgi:hypothetical protein
MAVHGIDLTQCFERTPRVLARGLGDETVLLDLGSGRYFSLNSTGQRIWALFAEESSLARVLERLVVEFDGPRSEIEDDLAAIVGRLEAEGLLLRVPGADPLSG